MKVVVTGGAGFIGSNYIYYHLEAHPKDEVICIDKLTYAGCFPTLKKATKNAKFRFYLADICHKSEIERIFQEEKPDVVINFAAESHVDRSIADPGIFIQSNVTGTLVLLEACRKFGNIRYHQISTDEVYGDLPLDKPELKFTERTPINPSSPYSASKASADMIVQAYYRTFKLPTTISRCSNNYGPYQFPEKLIPLMIVNCLDDKKLPIYGTGENVRDWLYVEDHCEAIDLIVTKGTIGGIYNIGGNNEISNINIVHNILNELDKPDTLIEFVEDRKGHDLRYAIDASKIRDELGWKPKVTFEKGMKKTIKWYLNNETWWASILSGEYRTAYVQETK